jgi:GTP-binding protein HflX
MIKERVYIVGLKTGRETQAEADNSIEEMERLAETAGAVVVGSSIQSREKQDAAFYIGEGKVQELEGLKIENSINTFLFDAQLSPSQIRNLEKGTGAKIVDRTELILDIFAQRARTHEAQLQVELAQLEYLLPRLTRMWTHLSRQAGGIGTRGPGEKQLEVDRRRIKERIALLKDDIEKVRAQRKLQRSRRSSVPLPVVSLVGYTNAGKSTLLNSLSGANVFVEDKLFATLDPTTRRIMLPNHEEVLVSDTVGFIQKLPVNLVTAFRATLEEVAEADLLLQVIDVSHPHSWEQIQAVYRVLEDLGIITKPIISVLNKIDKIKDEIPQKFYSLPNPVEISALQKKGLAKLLEKMAEILGEKRRQYKFEVPYDRMDVVSWLHKRGKVLKTKYYKGKVAVEAEIDPVNARRMKEFLVINKKNS